jgi:hypothetical protein
MVFLLAEDESLGSVGLAQIRPSICTTKSRAGPGRTRGRQSGHDAAVAADPFRLLRPRLSLLLRLSSCLRSSDRNPIALSQAGDGRPLPDAGYPARRHQGWGQGCLPPQRAPGSPWPPRRLHRRGRPCRRRAPVSPGVRRVPRPLRRQTPRRVRPPPSRFHVFLRAHLLLCLGLLVGFLRVRVWVRPRPRPRRRFLATDASGGRCWRLGGVNWLGIFTEGSHSARLPYQSGIRQVCQTGVEIENLRPLFPPCKKGLPGMSNTPMVSFLQHLQEGFVCSFA